jgi:hypothetical protein
MLLAFGINAEMHDEPAQPVLNPRNFTCSMQPPTPLRKLTGRALQAGKRSQKQISDHAKKAARRTLPDAIRTYVCK